MSKATRDALRNSYLEKLTNFLRSNNEEVLITGTNEFALPCVDSEGNDEFIVVTVKVPTGSRDGDAYDGYSMAEDFAMKMAEKKAKAEEAAAKKAAKIERDRKMREAKKSSKEAHRHGRKPKPKPPSETRGERKFSLFFRADGVVVWGALGL